jgi:hypothetical protein
MRMRQCTPRSPLPLPPLEVPGTVWQEVQKMSARRLLATLGSLHWTNPTLDRVIREYVRPGKATLSVPLPGLCAETAAACVSHSPSHCPARPGPTTWNSFGGCSTASLSSLLNMAQQKPEDRVVPEGGVMAVERAGSSPAQP